MNYRQMAVFLMICGLQILVGNWVGAKGYASGAAAAAFVESIPGLLVLLAIIVGGVAVAHFIPWKGLPAVAYIVTLGCIVTIPGFPGSEIFTAYVSKISYAGLAVGKDIDALKSQGWKIVVVGLFVFVGTFIGSAIIAEIVLRMMN